MPPALAALALLALTNPTAPGHALWNETPPDPLDPIPRTRHARARADHPAHCLKIYSLITMLVDLFGPWPGATFAAWLWVRGSSALLGPHCRGPRPSSGAWRAVRPPLLVHL